MSRRHEVGTYAIVHAGFAITSVDEASALETLAMLTEMGPLEDELGPPEPGDLRDVVKYLDEFGDPVLARQLLDAIAVATTRPWAVMEVCGGQTHSIIRHGIDQLLPDGIELIHGPGCPVCVTPLEIDRPGSAYRRSP